MSTILLSYIVSILLFFCVAFDVSSDREALISGGSKKTWYLMSSNPDVSSETCKSANAIATDNSYTFSYNGIFEFDHGEMTDDVGCLNDNCCSDLVNITGTWKLKNNDKKLRIVAEYETGNKSNVLQLTLFDATIDYLDENVLKLSQVDGETNVTYTYEFRKR